MLRVDIFSDLINYPEHKEENELFVKKLQVNKHTAHILVIQSAVKM